ncbi:MAG: NAD-dependent epimerase/dehydratase family protein [Glaciecola sp.]|jgi:nucleoside-diphosphate-sugar epimerase
MSKFLIIGLGWLGYPLARELKGAGAIVAGSTRSESKIHALKNENIEAFHYDLYLSNDVDINPERINNAHVVINIPPGRRNFDKALFIKQIKVLLDYCIANKAKQIIFISTTSVFGALTNKVNNHSPLSPNTPSGEAHVEIEQYLQAKSVKTGKECQISVLRLSGLVGLNRHPINTIAVKKGITQGKNPVNLVHLDDVIQTLIALSKRVERSFYAANLCSTEHPSRQEYYTWCAKELKLSLPEFAPDDRLDIDGKIIDASETLKDNDITLKYPSPFMMLPD